MSAPDAAPLPRLGEVFFDVRGSSRSMRLSWYADTDVAVFSIWQGGMCTGTFRLPMGELDRMIEILQRGPHERYEPAAGERPDAGYREDRYSDADYDDGPGYEDADYRDPGYRHPGSRDPGDRDRGDRDRGRGADQYGAPFGGSAYGDSEYGAGEYGSAGHGEPGYGDPRYRDPGYEPEYEQPSHGRRGAQWPVEGRYQPDATGQRSVAADETGYGQQRFVPPYVRAKPDPSEASYLDDSEYGLPADPGGGARHSAGRHSGGPPR